MAKGSGAKSTTSYVGATYSGPRTSTTTGTKGGADFWRAERFINGLRASYSIENRNYQLPQLSFSPYARRPYRLSAMDEYLQGKYH